MRLRWQDTHNWYTCEITQNSLAFYGAVSGTINQLGSTQSFSNLVAGHSYTLEFICAGLSPTRLTATLTDTTTSTVIVNAYAVADTSNGPQKAGSYGIGSNGGFTERVQADCYNQPQTSIAVNASGPYYSPYTWEYDGGGNPASNNIGASATKVRTNNAGAYIKINWTGMVLWLNYNQAPYAADGDYPGLLVSTDYGPWGSQIYPSSADGGSKILVALPTDSAHVTTIYVASWQNIDVAERWSLPAIGGSYSAAPYSCLEITGFVIEGSGTLQSYTPKSKKLLVYGDSITEGLHSSANDFTKQDARTTYVLGLAALFGAEYGVIAWSGAGITVGGSGNAPSLQSSWNYFRSGALRTYSGLILPAPDNVFVAAQANDSLNGVSNSTITSALNTLLAAIATACGSAVGYLAVEPGRFAKTATLAATLPATWYAIDGGQDSAYGLTDNPAGDGDGFYGSDGFGGSKPFGGAASWRSYDTAGHGDGGHLSIAAQMEYCMAVGQQILTRILGQASPRVPNLSGGMGG
jgi:lysophospholipase L1-like esterase